MLVNVQITQVTGSLVNIHIQNNGRVLVNVQSCIQMWHIKTKICPSHGSVEYVRKSVLRVYTNLLNSLLISLKL